MATRILCKPYAMLQGSLRAGCFKLCAYANRLRSPVQELGRVFKKPTQTAYATAVARRIQEPPWMHTFHNFSYATFKGVPFLYKSVLLSQKNAAQVSKGLSTCLNIHNHEVARFRLLNPRISALFTLCSETKSIFNVANGHKGSSKEAHRGQHLLELSIKKRLSLKPSTSINLLLQTCFCMDESGPRIYLTLKIPCNRLHNCKNSSYLRYCDIL